MSSVIIPPHTHHKIMFHRPPAKRIGAPTTPSADLSPPIQCMEIVLWVQPAMELIDAR